jgi:CrcB protein
MRLALIALGGALGTVMRYGAWLLTRRLFSANAQLTWLGTLAVNVVGCFVLALVTESALRGAKISEDMRLALSIGVCGGLTTYSSFNQEMLTLARDGHTLVAVATLVVTVVGCALASLAGLALARSVT